jgi:hypothetical protein
VSCAEVLVVCLVLVALVCWRDAALSMRKS